MNTPSSKNISMLYGIKVRTVTLVPCQISPPPEINHIALSKASHASLSLLLTLPEYNVVVYMDHLISKRSHWNTSEIPYKYYPNKVLKAHKFSNFFKKGINVHLKSIG